MKPMGLMEKIEEIRRKPEHIRMRYVWVWVGISMVLVLLIWFFSFKSGNEAVSTGDIFSPDQMKALDDLKVEKQSLEDTTAKIKGTLNQGNSQPVANQSEGLGL